MARPYTEAKAHEDLTMRRWISTTLAAAVVFSATGQAPAGEHIKKFFTNFSRDFKRNNLWPQPWVGPDRDSVYAPFQVMVSKGWERQNLLHTNHFEPDTGELTEAGRMKVDQILDITPTEHRAVYVPRGASPELTAKRIEQVQDYVATRATDEHPVQVVESRLRPNDYSAEYVDQIGRAFRESTPEPRIPAGQESTGGASQSGN